VAPKTRPGSRESSVVRPASTVTTSSPTGPRSSSLEELSRPAAPAQPLSSVARQLIRDLERRQLQLRQTGILSVGEVLDIGGVGQWLNASVCYWRLFQYYSYRPTASYTESYCKRCSRLSLTQLVSFSFPTKAYFNVLFS